jgi:trimeric autotransporter adhesin
MSNRSASRALRIALWPALLLAGIAAVLVPSVAALAAQSTPPNTAQQLVFAGLLTAANQGQFNAVATDASGNLYLLLDEHDGLRILKTDPTAATVLAATHLGSFGDTGLAMALDPSGQVYVTGTSTSNGSLAATAGAAFPARLGPTTNSFVAKFDTNLIPIFVTFSGSTETVAQSIAATADAVFITGSLFAATLPVTPAGIIQAPAYGSTQNGFVERFSSDGTALVYATYLSGATGNTVPAAIVADASDDAYVAGTTNASGYPTLAALVPRILTTPTQPSSGFLTELNPTGSGILFSTFIPGAGVSSLALDPVGNNLLLSGTIALGQFPVASAPMPLVDTPYQVVARIALDGSAVLSSTVVAPGTSSFVTPSAARGAWVDGNLSLPLLPLTPLSSMGNSFAAHIAGLATSIDIDQTARFGGLPSSNPTYASLALNLTSLATDAAGNPILAGSAAASASASLLATQTFDLALTSPTTALPSSLQDAIPPPVSCAGSLCPGNAAYLAKLSPTAAPALALSIDTAPIIPLRNLGSVEATGLQIAATGFTISTNCGTILAAGAECSLLLTGQGPGTLTVQAANAATQSATIPALASATPANSIAFSPKELDFGVQTSVSPPATRTLTVTNLGTTAQSFLSSLETPAAREFAESTSDCPLAGTPAASGSLKLLPAGASCHLTLALTASSDPARDGILQADWTIGGLSVLLTGYSQAAALNLSSSEIDFGLQFSGGLHPPRFLYLSNNSTAAVAHTAVTLPSSSPFTVNDLCPSSLAPTTICQLAITYQAASSTSSDAVTLALDAGLSALLTGETLPQPGVNGTAVNPSLSVSPVIAAFANLVNVTGVSSETQTVTIANAGAIAFTLSTTLTGDFTQSTNCASPLAAGAHCIVILSFAPSQPGARQGLLAITAGSGFAPAYVSLSGVATPVLAANNGTFSFGSVPVGEPVTQWHKITQPFNNLTEVTNSNDFTVFLVEDTGYGHGQPPSASFSSTATGGCSNCWIGIQFQPSTIGLESAVLAITSASGNPYTITLTGTGLPLTGLILTPLSNDFGPLPIHSVGPSALFTLSNLTAAAVTVNPPAFTGNFLLGAAVSGGPVCAGTLAVGASCFVEAALAPSTAGPLTGTLTLATSGGPATAALTGYGLADPGLSLNPTALNFANVPGTSSTVQIITLQNTGTSPLQIGPSTTSTASTTAPAFTASSPCSTLAPGATCTLTVDFTPSSATVTGALMIPVTSSIGGTPSQTVYTVPLDGTYTSEDAGLQILSSQASYGPTPTSSLGIARQFTLNNLSQKQIAVQLSLPRQYVLLDPTGPPCGSLASNAICSFTVAFLPLTHGDITGSLFAQATPSDGSAPLNGLGYFEGFGVGAGTLAITGSFQADGVLNFGQVASGQTAAQTLTLTNTGAGGNPASVTIRRITSEWPFHSTSTCGATLAVAQSCTVTLTYTPLNQIATGAATLSTGDAGTLVVESDAASSPDLIDLAGSSSPVAVSAPSNTALLAAFTASQGSLSFAATQVGDLSAPQAIDLTNTGTATVHITGFQTTPDFTVQNSCGTLLPGASCPLTVAFTPQQGPLGPRFSAVEIASDASTSLEFLSLYGAAATPANIVLAPTTLNFGSVLVGTPASLTVQVANNGGVPSTFTAVSATGDFAAAGDCPTAGRPLPANTSCTVQVTFTPTATGRRTGTLSVATDATTLPLTVALTGIGTQSLLQIAPGALSFGSLVLGASANLSLTLTNAGTATVQGLRLALTGDYALTVPCPTATLAPGATCIATVTFTPTSFGSRAGVLTIDSSGSNSPAAVPLTGTGISNGSFLLSVNGGTAASVTVVSGNPAAFNLTATPQNSFSGTVVLTCSAVIAAQNAFCALLPSSIPLAGTAQNAVATITTITSVAAAQLQRSRRSITALCVLAPGLLWSFGIGPGRRKSRRHTKLLLWAALTAFLAAASGCGSKVGVNPNLRYTPAGTYQYQVTASSTSGVQLSQTVTLNLTVQ